ncbi:Gfo/Idh/MocA family oxidoreductase [Rhizobium bangladeshense]|uniref:Gfo/Idh/MocA family oxidoreductase n=1 Tax=Rhizobium bangladeshense TaxID=1138189 RepID=A0ABS7LLP8_9HYPH|nr:Gfo/Idh/MocA family oxidoreductase [Rhizobium bangladeshense]MBY3592335.1 Gfo/Idh/MocA family oxidoreductase [Rhizobium bangladeshense]
MSSPGEPIRVLVAGLGKMGRSHALAYAANSGFDVAGLVNRSNVELPEALSGHRLMPSFKDALADLRPELCSINTYADSHAEFAVMAMEAGCHVFVEKPLASTAEDAEKVISCARANGRKLIVGYILRHHPSWQRLIAEARALGGPFVFRMNLNQQSSGRGWDEHKALLKSTSPIVDCGVHYVDVMCQITDAAPSWVRGMGLRMSDDIASGMYNYGHFQVGFADGSVGWYESGWGPMISETAFFVKDVMSPKGSVSIVADSDAKTGDVETAMRAASIRLHRASLAPGGAFAVADELIEMGDVSDPQELSNRQAEFVRRAIRDDIDLTRHMQDAYQSLRICLAADESVRTGAVINF